MIRVATGSPIRNASGYDVEYTYTESRLNAETGLMYYRHRVYHAGLGRFGSRDPIGYEAGVNLVEYVWDSPVNRNDPAGLQAGAYPGYWPPGYPRPQKLKRPGPGTGQGFQLCERDLDATNPIENCLNKITAAHQYIQYGPVGENGRPVPGTVGWGIGAIAEGELPQEETKFHPDKSWLLEKRPDGELPDGTPCSEATDQQIIECIKSHRTTAPYVPIDYDCTCWAREAIDKCCLSGGNTTPIHLFFTLFRPLCLPGAHGEPIW